MTKISNYRKTVREVVDGFQPGESYLTKEITELAEQRCEDCDVPKSARNDYTYSVLKVYERAGVLTRTVMYLANGKRVARWMKN